MKKALLFTALLSFGATLEAQTTYDWVSIDGDPNGMSASITLDVNSSSGLPGGNGSAADVLSFSVTDPNGTFNFNSSDITTLSSSFTWNPSQITSMNLQGEAYIIAPIEDYVTLTDNLLAEQAFVNFFPIAYGPIGPGYSDSGGFYAVSGASTIPDAANSAVLLGLALAGLGGFRRARDLTL